MPHVSPSALRSWCARGGTGCAHGLSAAGSGPPPRPPHDCCCCCCRAPDPEREEAGQPHDVGRGGLCDALGGQQEPLPLAGQVGERAGAAEASAYTGRWGLGPRLGSATRQPTDPWCALWPTEGREGAAHTSGVRITFEPRTYQARLVLPLKAPNPHAHRATPAAHADDPTQPSGNSPAFLHSMPCPVALLFPPSPYAVLIFDRSTNVPPASFVCEGCALVTPTRDMQLAASIETEAAAGVKFESE